MSSGINLVAPITEKTSKNIYQKMCAKIALLYVFT